VTKLLVIMGSGETTPTMIKPHRQFFAALGGGDRAALLDTPYGFQLNADEISARAVGYFAQSVGRTVDVVSWRTTPAPGLDRERALAALRGANWIFAGPGSPTYALRQWRDTELPSLLVQTEVLVFASAAALTLGSHTIPVYEIYKAGADPRWEPGLNLFEQLTGIPAVVIPHYDNAEGGHHDTRFCYLGEPRLARLERELPDDTVIIGIDEHTALVCDLETRTATVLGNGTLTLRHRTRTRTYPTGSVLPLPTTERKGTFLSFFVEEGHLLNADDAEGEVGGVGGVGHGVTGSGRGRVGPGRGGPGRGTAAGGAATGGIAAAGVPAEGVGGGSAVPGGVAATLREAADEAEARFSTALDERDVDGCVAAVLELEQAITDWSADTLTSDSGEHAHGLLRGMIVRLGALAGAADPTPLLTPLVDALIGLREKAREQRDWAAADRVRDALAAASIELRDTPDGPVWLRTP
jgi:cyanophycinase-like exopeptidase